MNIRIPGIGAALAPFSYEAYKRDVLLAWFKRTGHFVELGTALGCTECGATVSDVDNAIRHLQAHYPGMFVTENWGGKR